MNRISGFLRCLVSVLVITITVGCGTDKQIEPQPVGEPWFGSDGTRFQNMNNGQTAITEPGGQPVLYPK